jgi:hypothetical protein
MGILFYRATGRTDSARIDYEELIRAFDLAPEIYKHRIPASVEDEFSVPQEKGRLNVIAFTGLSPVKEQQNILIPLPFPFPNNSARLALPRMVERPQTIQRAEVTLDSGERFALELLEDMSAVARETFKSKLGLTILKTTARAISKAAASASAAAVAANRKNEGLGALVGALGRIYTEVSEQADTRLSRYFPRNALVGGVNLEPGYYAATISFYGYSGLVYSESREILVSPNSLNLMEFVCLK